MARNRFLKILEFLKLSNAKVSIKSYFFRSNDLFSKVNDIKELFILNWQWHFGINRNIVIDESICIF